MTYRLLDLFCGEGGAAQGYIDAGFTVTGVDITHHKTRYPGRFVQADALHYLQNYGARYDAIHASPPCQRYSMLHYLHDRDYPDLIDDTRKILETLDVPWIIENVPRAPLHHPIVLCGAAFGLETESYDGTKMVLRRHRLFESNVWLRPLPCACRRYRRNGYKVAGVYGHGPTNRKGMKPRQQDRKNLMGIDWMSRDGLSESIPPAYTQYLGERLLDWLTVGRSTRAL